LFDDWNLDMTRHASFFVLAGAFATLAAAAAQSAAPAPEHPTTYAIPPSLGDGWTTGAPEQMGLDRRRLEQMTDSIRSHPEDNVHAVLIERDGRLVYEEYFSGKDQRRGRPLGVVTFTRDTLHDLRSVTKSVMSALVGVASASGAIPSLDAPLLDYFPEYTDLQAPERRRITIRHALTMSAGLEWNEDLPYTDPKNDEIVMDGSPDPVRYVLGRPIVAAPGTIWRYSGGTTEVLGAILQRATKQSLTDYARTVLFSPLGIADFEWIGSGAMPSAASGLRLRPRDLARFGSLYLHDGQWNGRQVLPRTWVRESTERRLTFPGQEARGYGYQWWHTCYATPSGIVEAPTAVGNGMQRIFVLRAQRTVVTVLSGRYNDRSINPPERLLLDFILPALPPAPASACPA
jgi:CubicO group peptidase (beta-lactamase class C family)